MELQCHDATTRKLSLQADLQEQQFRVALLAETFSCMASGDLETGKIVLRAYIKGTIGFVALGKTLGKSPKSLMRVLGPQGNPSAGNLFDMIAHLQRVEGGSLRAEFVRGADRLAA